MKKYILILFYTLISAFTFSQTTIESKDTALLNLFLKNMAMSGIKYPYDSLDFTERLNTLRTTINNCSYIIEGIELSSDYYYIKEEDQTYYRKHVLVHKLLRGQNVAEGDTVIVIIKQQYPGNGPPVIEPAHSTYPLLWMYNKISCLFLTENIYRVETEPDQWSHFKKLIVWNENRAIGFGALYEPVTALNGIHVNANGVLFEKRLDWYNYLKRYPDIIVPESIK